MTAITVKNIPDGLYAQLKLSAQQHRRSINSELINCLEKTLNPTPKDTEALLANAQQIRQRLSHFKVTEQEIYDAKNQNRK